MATAWSSPPNEDGSTNGDADGTAPKDRVWSSRLFRLLQHLFSVHAELAKQELARDQSRLVGGLVFLTVGLTSIAMVVLLLQGVAVWLLVQRGLAVGLSLLFVSAGDLLLALICVLLARRAFQRPLLPQTRALIRRTISSVLP